VTTVSRNTSTIRKAYELRTEGFGEGSNGILQIAVDLTKCQRIDVPSR